MFENGRRKDVQDDNNYIDKYGYISHICPRCGNVYRSGIKLNVNCYMNDAEDGYSVSTPNIEKVCSCGTKTMQVDNQMAEIAKILLDKKYSIIHCCEGHAYLRNSELTFDMPHVVIVGNLVPLIPNNEKLLVSYSFGITTISPIYQYECLNSLDTFEPVKYDILEQIKNAVSSLPYNDNTAEHNYYFGDRRYCY